MVSANAASFVIFMIFFIIHLVGYVAPYWKNDSGGQYGMWHICDDYGCYTWFNESMPTYFYITFGLVSGSVLLLVCGFGAYIAWMCSTDKAKCNRNGGIACTIIASMLSAASVILFAIEESNNCCATVPEGWAFWLVVSSSFCLFLQSTITACCTTAISGGTVTPEDEEEGQVEMK